MKKLPGFIIISILGLFLILQVVIVAKAAPGDAPITGPITSPISPTEAPSVSPFESPTPTLTITPTESLTPTATETPTPTITISPTETPTPTPTEDTEFVKGHISLQVFRFFGHSITTPAAHVTVTATGFFDNGIKLSTKTDSNGNYSLEVPAQTLYEMAVKDNKPNTFFFPILKLVNIKDNEKKVNFQGLTFTNL